MDELDNVGRVADELETDTGQSSDGDDNIKDLESRKLWKANDTLLAEYDHLGRTPPRTRIRNKEKHKMIHTESNTDAPPPRSQSRVIRRNTEDNIVLRDTNLTQELYEQKRAKRRSLKTVRAHDRDLKLDIDKCRENNAESGRQFQIFMTPKLVESCNRFKSLHSQPITHIRDSQKLCETSSDGVVDQRANFHSTFSMLIKLGNADKNCRRTLSVEEFTWQNELKDLLWLEVCAHHAGRTATQQDAYLLIHRESVQILLNKILDYKFVYTGKRCTHGGIYTTQDRNDEADHNDEQPTVENNIERYAECLCIDCHVCSKMIGDAMYEVDTLLNSLSEAEALYPSSKGMAAQHPIINSDVFIDKTKAMCLWYNMMHHQRLKILIIKKLLYKHRWKISSQVKKDVTVADNTQDNAKVNHSSGHRVKFKINDETLTGNFDDDTDDDNDVKQSTQIHIKPTQQTVDSGIDLLKNCDDANCIKENQFDPKNIASDFPNVENSRSPYESTESSSGVSINSNESGFNSTNDNSDDNANHISLDEFNVYNMGSLGDLTKLRLFNPKLISPYRDYIEKMLKVRGLKRALYFLEKLHLSVLKKARMTLEKYEMDILNEDVELRNDQNGDSSDDDFEYERHTRCEVDIKELKKECIDLRRYGAWSKETLEMALPSYRSAFLFLSMVPIENIHEFLTMRLESKPEKPSVLSIKQLIHELREGIAIAVRLRARFIRHVHTALTTEPDDTKYQKFYNKILTTFDNTLDEVYKLYLSYLSDWAGMEHLPRTTLTAEWNFNYYLAHRLRPAATFAPLTFCCLTVRQLESAADRLKNRVKELREKAESFTKDDLNNSIKLRILAICRNLQCLLSEEKERALSTAQFARTVSTHLHHNVVFREYRQKIYKAMFAVQKKICWTIDQMQETTSPQRLLELEENDRPSVQSRTREILSQGYKFGFEFHKELCRLINESGYNTLARNSLLMCRQSKLTRADSINYDNIQATIEESYFSMNPYTPSSNNEFTYPNECPKKSNSEKTKDEVALSFSLYGRKDSNTKTRTNIRNRRSPRLNAFNDVSDLSDLKPEDFQNGIPGCESCNRINVQDDTDSTCFPKFTGDKMATVCDWEITVSKGLVKFAKQWMHFALTRCERGRGLRPRWANHGLDFLMLTCDPQHTKHLTNEEFEELKSMMDGCISHVIGSSRGANNANGNTPTTGTPTPGVRPRTSPMNHYNMSNKGLHPLSPPTPPVEPDLSSHSFNKETSQSNKHLIAINKLDNERDGILRRTGAIGNVRLGSRSKHHFRPRPVTFKWQRGIKIGQGRFGKVYTVVNTESGQLLAMKEVSLGVGDIRAVDLAANELKVLESVVHPNLVRYYGVETHREEILIFMELCVEGSLESMIAGCSSNTDGSSGNGLPEQSIRRYTGQLVSAIQALHERSIAHRDIKSGNIFLTEGGNCLKLGDFGCAVKIRANTTVPGELRGYVGTQAYMAPEVFMKSSGHGRAADIWSLGCVVVEMASGKHPWSEYDSNYQIMFVVGMGNRPEIPSTLSAEGLNFCMDCLQHDPNDRVSAEKLASHHFLKVNRY